MAVLEICVASFMSEVEAMDGTYSPTALKRALRFSWQRAILAASCALLATSVIAQTGQKQPASPVHGRPRHAAPVVKSPPPVPEPAVDVQPLPPPPPLTPEQMPPQKPRVSWDGKELTIISTNSTLADILTEVRTLTGAALDIPPNASHERIAAQLGPGPAREMLSTLLSWTDFDYIIQASDTDALAIQSVLLTPRGKNDGAGARGDAGMVAENMARSRRRSVRANPSIEETPASENTASVQPENPPDATASSNQPAGSSPQPAMAAAQPAPGDVAVVSADAQPPQTNLASSTAVSDSSANQAQMSESEQRIQQMQNLFEQRKQMMDKVRKPPAN